jgi:rhodanese-related sulfurtransferase
MNLTMMDAKEVERCRDKALLLDVRTPGEFGAEHIDGAVLHPLDRLDPEMVRKWTAERGRCVVVCRSGKRASMAAEKLAGAGISDLAILGGGMDGWKAAGLPVNRGRGVISIERQVRIGAGALVLAGEGLGLAVNAAWFGLAAFVGAGLVFAGVTDFCGMGILLAKMPWNQRGGGCCSK